jgi:retron-type reverse transcriptase
MEKYGSNVSILPKTTSNTTTKKLKGTADLDALVVLTSKNKNDPTMINIKLVEILSNINILIAAYSRIKSNPGNMTPSTTTETLDGIDIKYFLNLQKDIRTGKFSFAPARRILIPKSKGKRPLTMAAPREKIVQMAIAMVLEAIYNPSFSPNSLFRPNMGVHTALRQVKKTFTSVN